MSKRLLLVLLACCAALLPAASAVDPVFISEFVASNENGLRDEDGETSDWIEIYNSGATPVNLAGWRLTDDALDPNKWLLPAVTVDPKGFLIVFASDKNRSLPTAPLHTNFRLSADGGYLALIKPDNSIAHEFNPYPAQYPDKPFGFLQTVTTTALVGPTHALKYLVPTSSTPTNATWTARTFNDSGWTSGTNGVGFESTVPGFTLKTVFSNQDVGSLSQAEAVLSTPSLQSNTEIVTHPVVNFDDSGSPGHYGSENPPPALEGGNHERFVVEATGIITVPTSGIWTFCVTSDDGCSLQIRPVGQPTYTTVLAFAGLRGMGDSIGTYTFPSAGDYEIRAIIFENGGGAGGEVSARQGSAASWDGNFQLIGGAGGLAVKSVPSGTAASGYTAHVGANTLSAMNEASPQKSSAYIRYSFTNPGGLTSLTAPVRYDDGCIIYLNGTEIARRNAPAGTPSNTSVALGNRLATLGIVPEHINIPIGGLVSGTNVLAVHAMNESAGNGDFLLKAELAQYTVNNAAVGSFFTAATPGAFNTAPVYNKVAPVVASVQRGFYTTAQSVTLTTGTPSATIRYTFDGSTPVEAAGASATYSAPITINKTTTLRYRAFRAGFDPSEVVTQTYVFPADVLTQSPTGTPPVITNPAGATQATTSWPAGPINGQILDYGMDPDIVNNAPWNSTLVDDLKSLPTFSIVTDLPHLFDQTTGIYVNPSGDEKVWERPTSLELINPDGSPGFQINCGIRIRGGFSRSTANPKHAFRFFFRDEYGAGKLRYDLFGDAPGAAEEFDKIDLRTFQNYSWSFGGDASGVFVRDTVARDMQLAAGQVSSHGGCYHLYINGHYWGIFNVDERPDANFGASYFGGNSDDYDTIKIDPDSGYNIEATDGNTQAWFNLWQLADAGLAAGNTATVNNTAYQRMLGNNPDGTRNPTYPVLLDPLNLIDEMLIVFWGGNKDAPISNFLENNSPNNWYGFRNREGVHGGFKFVLHDSEHTLLPGDLNIDRTGPWAAGSTALQGAGAFGKSSPQYIFQQAVHSLEFKTLLADRVYKHFFNGGILTPEGALAIFNARTTEIDRAVVAESARWGDSKVGTPHTRNTWLAACSDVRNNFIPQRTAIVLTQLRNKGWYPSFEPAVFSRPSGTLTAGTAVTITFAPGTPVGSTIYYTTNGTDPRALGGGLAPGVLSIASGGSLTINASTSIRLRVRNGATWSALNEATYYVTQDYSPLAITEIHYDPLDGSDLEFIELKNTGPSELDLGGLSFSGITFTFPAGRKLAPGAFAVIVRNEVAFTALYPGVPVAGSFTGGLASAGEQISIAAAGGGTVISVTYDNEAPWPAAAAGNGFSLVPKGTVYNSSEGYDWRASANVHGSPGADDPPSSIPAIVVNEVLSNSPLPLKDTIELHNPTGAPVNIGDWWLTDDPDVPQKYRIPAGTTIPAGGHIFFDEGQFNTGAGLSFALGTDGDDAYIFSGNASGALTGYSHGVEFAGTEAGVSLGRYINSVGEEQFPRQISRTLGGPNSGPLVGPLVINEIMYRPFAGYDEFIEIRNLTASPVNLFDPANPANTWRLAGVAFSFPTSSSVPANGYALVVNIDPATFRTKYAIPAQVPIYGPFTGTLQDNGERLALEKPGTPIPPTPPETVTVVPYSVIDNVRYNDNAPWPIEANGFGPSLQRTISSSYGDDPINWFANGATPGLANSTNNSPSVSLTSPVNNAAFTLPVNITFQATASDTDGTIAKVEYYVDGGKVGESTTGPNYTFNWTATGGLHTVDAKAIDNSLGITTSTPVTILVTQPVTQGLTGTYYANTALAAPVAFTRTDATVNFSDAGGAWVNFGGVGTDQFSVRWTGQVFAPTSGSYTFYAAADDGVRLTVNGVQLVNAWVLQGETEYSGTISLTGGQLYTVTMEMFENNGGAAARLRWSGPGIGKQIIPQNRLYPESTPIIITHPGSATREYGTSMTFTVVASGTSNEYQWRKNGNPIPGVSGASYTIPFVTQADAAQYSVLIFNGSGYAISNNATLNVTFTDSDNDGMNNAWETANGLNPNSSADANLDTDGDGLTNAQEFQAGTDPRNSMNNLAATVTRVGNDMKITFTARPWVGYTVRRTNEVRIPTWIKVQEIPPAAGTRTVDVLDIGGANHPTRFYQVITPIQ